LLAEIGHASSVRFQPLLDIPVFARGRWAALRSARLPGPLHLLPTLLGYRHLPARDRRRLAGLAPALMRGGHRLHDHLSFAEWLRRNGQSPESIRHLWDLVGVAVLNGRAEDVSAGLAAEAFRIGVVSGWRAARLGYFTAPLGRIAEAAVESLLKRGVRVLFHQAVERLRVEGGRVCGVRLRNGVDLEADAVICAVPPDAVARLLPDEWQSHPVLSRFKELTWSAIANVYLLYDRPVFHLEVAAFTGGVLQFAFNRGRLLGDSGLDGRWIAVSLSAANHLRGLSGEELAGQVDAELREAVAIPAGAKLDSASAVWQPRATFLAKPGTWDIRPKPASPIEGLFWAGDWTDTGWPACLEGAVRSGQAAARAVLARLSSAG
ncbi:MAG: FAD-dependent oxidoreductase, partial [Alicyclobacillus sp.]|nr:FAD-dependent oxidoreductase [Alicyclobacillus sp.]